MIDRWTTDRYDVRCGDLLRLIGELERESLHAVVTDCPYSSGGMTRGDRSASAHSKYISSDSSIKTLGYFEGDTRDQRGWAHWCALWYADCWRAAKPGAVLLTFTDWRQLPATTDAVQAGGWIWRGISPWNKGGGSRPQKGRMRQQCEYIVFGTKGPHEPWGEDAPCLDGFFDDAPVHTTERHHITEKPVPLLEKLVTLAPPEGRVLDPCGGSGSTPAACIRTGRYPITFEIVPENAALIVERCEAELSCTTIAADRAGQVPLFGGSSAP